LAQGSKLFPQLNNSTGTIQEACSQRSLKIKQQNPANIYRTTDYMDDKEKAA